MTNKRNIQDVFATDADDLNTYTIINPFPFEKEAKVDNDAKEKEEEKESPQTLVGSLFNSRKSIFSNLLLLWLDQIDLRNLSVTCKQFKKCIQENVTKEEWEKRIIQKNLKKNNSIHMSFTCMQMGYFVLANDWFLFAYQDAFVRKSINERNEMEKKVMENGLNYAELSDEIMFLQYVKNRKNDFPYTPFCNYFRLNNFSEKMVKLPSTLISSLSDKLHLEEERKFQIIILSNLFSNFMKHYMEPAARGWLETIAEYSSSVELFKIAFSSANKLVKSEEDVLMCLEVATIAGNTEIVKYLYEISKPEICNAIELAVENNRLETLQFLLSVNPKTQLLKFIEIAKKCKSMEILNFLIETCPKPPENWSTSKVPNFNSKEKMETESNK